MHCIGLLHITGHSFSPPVPVGQRIDSKAEKSARNLGGDRPIVNCDLLGIRLAVYEVMLCLQGSNGMERTKNNL